MFGSKQKSEECARPVSLTMDSATLYELVAFFQLKGDAYTWAIEAAILVTLAITTSDNILISPSPRASKPAGDDYAKLITALSGLSNVWAQDGSSPTSPDRSKEVGTRAAKSKQAATWAIKSADKIAEAYAMLRINAVFQAWLDQSKRAAWAEHAGRLGSLYDPAFIVATEKVFCLLPKALDLVPSARSVITHIPSIGELKKLQDKGKNPSLATSADHIQTLEHAYVISALIRGYFHHLMRPQVGQLTRHPFRGSVLRHVDKSLWTGTGAPTRFIVWHTEIYFANIVLADASKESSVGERIARWVKNLDKARKAYLDRSIDLEPGDDPWNARHKAAKAAQKIGITISSKAVEIAINTTIDAAVRVACDYTLAQWGIKNETRDGNFIKDVASSVVTNSLKAVSQTLIQKPLQNLASYPHLRNLAVSGPGIVSYSSYKLELPKSSVLIQPDGQAPSEPKDLGEAADAFS